MNKILEKIKNHKRRLTQVIAAVLYNCHFTGFIDGNISTYPTKQVCVPGLNCYSCPGAIGACPLGSFQSALVNSHLRFPYYVLGMLILFGLLFGRFICGFLCPFGLIQELVYKIPVKKLKKNRLTRALSWLKYGILVVFALIIPIALKKPGFCKYICPAGTLEAGALLGLTNGDVRAMLGNIFLWKCFILVLFLISFAFIYRNFCRFICPLGAFYSLFNKIACVQMIIDADRCIDCGACRKFCKMDVKKIGDRECIQCGECMKVCRKKAISRRIMAPTPKPVTEETKAALKDKGIENKTA